MYRTLQLLSTYSTIKHKQIVNINSKYLLTKTDMCSDTFNFIPLGNSF